MSIPSPAVLAYRGGAMLNFAITEFSEVRVLRILGSRTSGVAPSRKFAPEVGIWHHGPSSPKGLIQEASLLGKEVPNARRHRPPNSRFSDRSCSRWAGVGAEPILNRAAQATQRRCRLHLRRLGCRLRRAFRAHAYRRLGTMERGPGRRF